MRSGVYKITNKVNGKFYIGSSEDIDFRWVCHKRNLRGKRHANARLQNAWNKYGVNSFIFEVVEEIDPTPALLFERENHYLSTLKPYDRSVGYNICPNAQGGDNFTYNPRKEEIRKTMRESNLGEKNGMFGKNHTKEAVKKQKKMSVGRYTLPWFMGRYGKKIGLEKFEERRTMLMNRKINYATVEIPEMSFKGQKHSKEYYERRKHTEEYFKYHWNDFVEIVKSGKYSQRQLSTMLNISRPTLKKRMRQAMGQ